MLPPYPMLTTKNWDAAGRIAVMALLGVVMLAGCMPPGPRSLLDGERLIREKKYAKAVERLKTATEENTGSARAKAWNFLGLAYHGDGKPTEAAAAYQKAIQLDSNLAVAHFNLGSLLLEQNQPAAALAPLSTYTVLERNRASGWAKLGAAQLRLKQIDAAENSFRAALSLNPSMPEALNGMAIVQLHQQRLQEAVDFFNAAVRRDPPYGPALLNLAIVSQYYLNNPQMALQRYQSYASLTPTPPKAQAVRHVIQRLEAQLAPPAIVQTVPPPSDTKLPERTDNAAPPAETATASPPLVGAAGQTPSDSARPSSEDQTATNRVTGSETGTAARHPQMAAVQPKMPTSAATNARPDTATAAPPQSQADPTATAARSGDGNSPVVQSQPTNTTPATVAKPNANPPVAIAAPELADAQTESPANAPVPENNSAPETSVRGEAAAPARASQSEDPIGAGMIVTRSGDRPGLAQRINPRNWFREGSEEEVQPDPEQSPATSMQMEKTSPPLVVRSATNSTRSPQVARAIPSPTRRVSGPRYSYRSPAAPRPGDRRRAEPLFSEALRAHKARRLTTAIEGYRQVVKIDPSYYEAYYNLGLATYDLKDYAQSLVAYELALAIHPDSFDARFNFALALQQAGYPSDAARELNKLLPDHGQNPRLHFTLGRIYAEELRDTLAARRHYQRVLELDPQHQHAIPIRYWLAEHP